MSHVTYEQAYSDRQYLWRTYGEASDMTGAYCDQEDLEKLFARPTKAQARDCLIDQIHYWFVAGYGDDPTHKAFNPETENDLQVAEIADRYLIDDKHWPMTHLPDAMMEARK